MDSWKKEKESCEQSYEARIAKIKQESKELTSQYKKEMEGAYVGYYRGLLVLFNLIRY